MVSLAYQAMLSSDEKYYISILNIIQGSTIVTGIVGIGET